MQDTLSDAYALDGPEACKALYQRWADTYDSDFAQARDYLLPGVIAATARQSVVAPRRILDVGAGTGLVGQALRAVGVTAPIDAVDLSADMLAHARTKGVYDDLMVVDITVPLTIGARYDLIVSAGTFTHGHVGPQGLINLLTLCQAGSVMLVSINEKIWESNGFRHVLEDRNRFSDVLVTQTPIYGAAAVVLDPVHARDTALIARVTVA